MKLKAKHKKTLLSIIISMMVLSANYVVGNTSIPVPDEMRVLRYCDRAKAFLGLHQDSIPHEVMLIDVYYDKQLIDYAEPKYGKPMGKYVITDRKKLLDFLSIAKKANSHKYIFLDVIFEEGMTTEQDSALFATIASMDNIVIPCHENKPLQDSILYTKAANSDYTVTWEDNDFARFQFIHQGVKSAPLRIYEDLEHKTITQHGLLFTSNGWLCRNGVSLKLPITITGNSKKEGVWKHYDVCNLGTDILSSDVQIPIAEQIRNKIVVIGDFENDKHDTYAGTQPGSVICLNAYYALLRGDHMLSGWTLLFYGVIAALYYFLTLSYLERKTLQSYVKNAWLKVAFSLLNISFIFWAIAFAVYILFDIVYCVWVPIGIFSLLDFCISIYYSRQDIKDTFRSIKKECIEKYKQILNRFKHEKAGDNDSSALATTSNRQS